MRVRWGILLAAGGAAVVAHVAAALAVRGVPLVGTEEFARTASELVGRAEIARAPARDPLLLSLGTAERSPVEAPGPRPVLDPAALRRPPRMESDCLGRARERLAVGAEIILRSSGEAREALRVLPPGLGSPAGRWTPSAADREVADVAIGLGAREVTRPLPPRFMPAPSVVELAASARAKLLPREAKLDIPTDRTVPLPPPDWPEPDRPVRAPEVFVDVLEAAGRR